MNKNQEETFHGLGRRERRRMIRRWKVEGEGKSLKDWARTCAQVGDAALAWIENKKVI